MSQRLSSQDRYNTPVIRKLLTSAFSDEDFTIFCYDHFREVQQSFGSSMTFRSKVQLLIEHCEKNNLFDELLPLVKEFNPNKYAEFASSLQKTITQGRERQDKKKVVLRIQVYLQGDLSSLSIDRKSAAIEAFAAVMGVSPQAIEVYRVYEGSIVFDLGVPPDAAQRLRSLLQSNSAQLRLLRVEKVILEKESGEIEEWIIKEGKFDLVISTSTKRPKVIKRLPQNTLTTSGLEEKTSLQNSIYESTQSIKPRTQTVIATPAPWLRNLGFKHDPFIFPKAEDMPPASLEDTFVPHPGFDEYILDFDHSAVLLAPPGSGKTAGRLRLELHLNRRQQSIFVGQIQTGGSPHAPLVATYDNFEQLVERLPSVGLQDHASPLLTVTAEAFCGFMIAYPNQFITLDKKSQDWWWGFLDKHLRGESLDFRLQDSPLLASNWQPKTAYPYPFRSDTSLQQILTGLQKRLTKLGLDDLFILVDGVDVYIKPASQLHLENLVEQLLNTLPLLPLPRVVWKIFLPDILEEAVLRSKGYQTGRLNLVSINWDEPSLTKFLQQRLEWASDGLVGNLSQLCDLELRQVDIDQELAHMALWHKRLGPPRALLSLGGQLLRKLAAGRLISLEDWNDFKEQVQRDLLPEIVSVHQPNVYSAEEQLPFEEKLLVEIPLELLEQLRKGNIVLFCGAGISVSEGGLPSGGELAQELAKRAGLGDVSKMTLPQVAENYELEQGRQSLIDYITSRIDDPRYTPLPTHRLITALPFKQIITANWDNFLEETLRQVGRPFVKIVRDADVAYADEKKTVLVKVHGSIEQKDSIVITGDDYYDVFARLPETANVVRAYFATKTLLFLGFGLADEDFKRLYYEVVRHLGSHKRRAYAVQLNPLPLTVKYWQQKNVQVIAADAAAFLEALRERLGAAEQ